jgi:hypothetical protein
MTSMDDLIRAAAGRQDHTTMTPETPVGDLGGGRGGSARPMPTRRQSAEISDAIRAAAGVVRGKVTLDDLWRR